MTPQVIERASEVQPATGQGTRAIRIPAFDFIKGALVLFMVLFHWLNYFYGPDPNLYRYLRFLTPSFIFITGFLISHVHFVKYGAGSLQLSKRLFLRGMKIVGLFIFLNLMIGALFPTSSERTLLFEHPSVANLSAIFLSGNVVVNGIGKTTSFNILVSIGYLLMVSAVLLSISRVFKQIFFVVCGLLLLAVLWLHLMGVGSFNLECLSVGILGVVLGYIPAARIDKIPEHPYAVVVTYCAYLVAITFWEIPFIFQVAGVCLTVTLLYIVGSSQGKPGFMRRHILLLGKYSLFAYIIQIAILQVLYRIYMRTDFGDDSGLVIAFMAGFALTMISVEVVDWARRQARVVDKLYKVVFA